MLPEFNPTERGTGFMMAWKTKMQTSEENGQKYVLEKSLRREHVSRTTCTIYQNSTKN